MKLEQIRIQNFRCFEDLTVDLYPNLTVLIAKNGAGKTAILDAIRDSLHPFIFAFDTLDSSITGTLKTTDVRWTRQQQGNIEQVLPCSVVTIGIYDQKYGIRRWKQYIDRLRPEVSGGYDSAAEKILKYGKSISSRVQQPEYFDYNLPIVAYFGIERLKVISIDNDYYSRLSGYKNCLSNSSSYYLFQKWFTWIYQSYREAQMEVMELGGKLDKEGQRFADAIEVIVNAVNKVTEKETGWKNIAYSSRFNKTIVMQHDEHGFLPVEYLSDGLKNAISMVAQIAFRCIRLNPHLGINAAKETDGVVMIDEIDLHLHPSWQQTIIGSLHRAFPKIQFIVTTHSPQVLSTVPVESIRLLDNGKVIPLHEQTQGIASSDILASIMDVNPVPALEISRKLSHYKGLIQQNLEQSEEGEKLREELITHFGTDHPEIQECDTLVRFEQFKRSTENA